MIYPQNFENKIGFDEVRHILETHCLSPLGVERVAGMHFLKDARQLKEIQSQTREFLRIMEGEEDFPEQNFYDVRDAVKRIRVEGTYLDEQELFDLKRSLETIADIVRFLTHDEEGNTITSVDDNETDCSEDETRPDGEQSQQKVNVRYPALLKLTRHVMVFPQLIRRIGDILDKYGKIKDTASSELLRIRRELASIENSISRTLNGILRSAQQDGVVDKDVTPTMRDGRLVIPVAPALKRKIKGIVHDESATGKTVFIEPAEVVEANNRIRELESEERREIIRILQEFTALVRPYYSEIIKSYEFLAEIDFIRAKAHMAVQFKAITPEIKPYPIIDWYGAVHPLLALSLQRHNKAVVPLDIILNRHKRILIISGPNAGGKSVCLKTVGLLQYMLQCGLPVPLKECSTTGIFDSIFIDIGDEQSIENDLSTYSSHLLNMKNMMKYCGGTSLLLIDEFGGGTEPQIGGAIAEAVLKRFNQKKSFGVITTHYQNLKHFAEDHEGVVNGAMLYDRQHMQALFQLEIGNPGSSFAVEIARKIGIPEDVIAEASNLVGMEYINADKYLQDIMRDKRYWENKRQSIHQREKEMEKTIARYEAEITELQQSRKDILKQAKDEAAQLLQQSTAKIESTIKNKIARKMQQLMERKKRQAERKERKATEAANKKADEQLRNEQAAREAALRNKPLAVGDTVRIKGQTTVGEIEEIDGKNAIVTFGIMRTNVKADRLERATPPEKPILTANTYISKQTQDAVYEKKLSFKQDIDIRGMRGDEAIQAVTYFIDDAILLGISRVRILHGTGNGILRTLVRQYLQTVRAVSNYRDEHVQFGGAGITVVDIG